MKNTNLYFMFASSSKAFLRSLLLVIGAAANTWAQVPSAPAAAPAATQGQPASPQGRPSAPAQGRPSAPAPGQVAQPTNGQPQATDATPTDPKADPKKGPMEQLEKADDGTQRVNDVQANEVELRRKQKLQALREKIFGSQIFTNAKNNFSSNNPATPRDYTIGPNDELKVYIYGYSQNNFDLLVNTDGFAVLPRVGIVQLSGRTIEQAQKELIQRLSPYFMNLGMPGSSSSTFLQITLGRIREIRVTVLGEAITPGTYSISSLSTALDVLQLTGGPNELGSFREIKVIRKNKVVSTVDIYELLMNGTLTTDVRLQDNDIVQIPVVKKRVETKGSFRRPGLFELLPNETFAKVLDYSAGFTENAYTDRVVVLGLTARERRITDLRNEEFAKYIPNNGDEMTASELLARFENMVTIAGPVFRPGSYSLNQNKTLLQLIKNADGLKGEAFTGRINVIRTREDLSVENISLNLADMINGKTSDLELMREDQIIIPSKFELREPAYIRIQGAVNKKDLELPYTSNLTIEDIIIQAGGFQEAAATSQIEVVRRKRDVNLLLLDAEISKVFSFKINPDLTLDGDDSRFVLEPYDEIVVRAASNYQAQVFVTVKGEVINPGAYGLKNKDEKLSDLIIRSGGLTAQAYEKGATLFRLVKLSTEEIETRSKTVAEIADDAKKGTFITEEITANKQEAIGIDLLKIIKNPGSREDIILQDGDIISIPKRLETVRLQGELLRPTTVKYREGDSFSDYISQGGGFTQASLKRRSYVVYPNGSIDRTRKFLFFNIYPRVEPGSEIIVPKRTASDLLEAQKGLQALIGVVQATVLLFTSVIAVQALTK